MKDRAGKELEAGQRVAYIPQGGYTYALDLGVVADITPKKVKIKVGESAVYNSTGFVYKFPEQVCVV